MNNDPEDVPCEAPTCDKFALKVAGGRADAPVMPSYRRLLNGAAVAALVVALPTVSAGAAVRGNGSGNSGHGNGNWSNGNGNGNAPAQTPASPGASPSAPAISYQRCACR